CTASLPASRSLVAGSVPVPFPRALPPGAGIDVRPRATLQILLALPHRMRPTARVRRSQQSFRQSRIVPLPSLLTEPCAYRRTLPPPQETGAARPRRRTDPLADRCIAHRVTRGRAPNPARPDYGETHS